MPDKDGWWLPCNTGCCNRRLKDGQEKALKEFLDSRAELNDADVLTAIRLVMATPAISSGLSIFMKNEITLQTRREFLRTTMLGSALSWTVPAFLAGTFAALQSEAADSATQIVTGKDATILVVLQMAGGNDGLNTVVPYTNDNYHRARPKIGLSAQQVLSLNDEIGFHGALTGFKSLYDAGNLAVVQGVGYPNPNRSHFRSTEIWQTASDPDKVEKYGWLGRYFDNACSGGGSDGGCDNWRSDAGGFFCPNAHGHLLQQPAKLPFQCPTIMPGRGRLMRRKRPMKK